MLEFEYKYVHDSLDELREAVERAQVDMEKAEGSKNHIYFVGVYHGRLGVYSSMVYYWTKIITGKGGD